MKARRARSRRLMRRVVMLAFVPVFLAVAVAAVFVFDARRGTPPQSLWSVAPSGRLVCSKRGTGIYDKSLLTAIRDVAWNQMLASPRAEDCRHFTRFDFREVWLQQFVEPLRKDAHAPSDSTAILARVNQELRGLGTPSGYTLREIHELEDLADACTERTICVVTRLGHHVTAEVILTADDGGAHTLSLEIDRDACGCTAAPEDGPGEVPRVFVGAIQRLRINLVGSLFCEPLHHETGDATRRLAKTLLAKKGGLKAATIASLTDEAVVHGIFLDWVEELQGPLGIADAEIEETRRGNDMNFVYLGARVMREKASKLGRRAALQGYLRDPLGVWTTLEQAVPAYGNLDKIDEAGIGPK